MSTHTPARVQPGVPTGGQFAASHRHEPGVELSDAAPRPLLDELTESGGDLTLSAFEHQDDVFTTISAHHEAGDGALALTASVAISPKECLASFMPPGLDDDASEAWLEERSEAITAWFKDEYGIEQFAQSDDWSYVEAEFEAHAPLDLATDDLTGHLRSNTKAVDLYNESDPGTYGCRNLWTALGEHLTSLD